LQNRAPAAALLAAPNVIGDLAPDLLAGGPRDVIANRPIKTPADLNGLKMRAPNAPMRVMA